MALIDAFIQSTAGILAGWCLYLVSLPMWSHLTFEAVPIRASEMLLPWWLSLLLGSALLALNLFAAGWGLRQVRISPLGVSRRTNRPVLRVWRLVLLAVVVLVASVVAPASLHADGGLYVFAGVVVALLLGLECAGPWILQLVVRPFTRTRWTGLMWAARRIIADPVATWRRVSTLGVLAFVGGYLGSMPFSYDDDQARSQAEHTFMTGARADFVRGATVTLALGFALTAVSLLLTTASATIERAEQSRALHRMGAPAVFDLRVMWLETFGPLTLSTVMGALLGVWAAQPLAHLIRKQGLDHGQGFTPIVLTLASGLVVAGLSLLASHPLHRRLLHLDVPHRD